jgi:hypothetical protein
VNSTSGCLDKIEIERKNHLVSALFGQYPFNMGYSIYWWSNRKNSFLLIGPWNVASSDALLSAFCWPPERKLFPVHRAMECGLLRCVVICILLAVIIIISLGMAAHYL